MNKLLRFLGYASAVIPMKDALGSRDKRFFILFEQPLLGIFSTLASLLIAGAIAGIHYSSGLRFFRDFIEIYLAYHLVNIIRNGVNIHDEINRPNKIMLNWFYSIVLYSISTAGDRLLKAQTEAEHVFAVTLIVFAVLWPLLSQTLSTCIWTPVMYSFFPAKALLDKLGDTSQETADIISAGENGEIRINKWDRKWISWFRPVGETGNSRTRRYFVCYWFIKTAYASLSAIIMTTMYYLLRWFLAGYSAAQSGILTRLLGEIF